MWKVLFRARNRFARDQRGNVAVLFAFSAIPLIGLLGGAVDVTRHHRYKAELLNAMDATAIALVRSEPGSDAEADEFVNRYMATMMPGDGNDRTLHMNAFDAIKVDGGYRVVSNGNMDTAFMPVVGISQMPLDLETEVRTSGGDYEIALALDNTGSMRNFGRIGALRDAAEQLVHDLYDGEEGTEDRVKMALVPFVTSVNVGYSDGFDRAAHIDPVGADPVFQKNFRDPSGNPVNRLTLFANMKTEWAGCVEARIEGDEDGDTLPDSAASKWVPYLWPDEPGEKNRTDRGFTNSYLTDASTGDDSDRLRNTAKYTVTRAPTNTSNLGPNAACPTKVIPLTNDDDLMVQNIRAMKPHNEFGSNNSGTNVAQGLVWGWRALSPDSPFAGHEGVDYNDGKTTKVLVLLSDGRNQIVANDEITESDYTSFGYLADGRLGTTDDYLAAERNVDAKVSRVCEAVKDTGIRVYTILFQVDFEKTQDLFRDCASVDEKTGKPLYYYVPDASALETAFQDIGKDLSTLRITR
jgi:Flp pilus assembly protein TadG